MLLAPLRCQPMLFNNLIHILALHLCKIMGTCRIKKRATDMLLTPVLRQPMLFNELVLTLALYRCKIIGTCRIQNTLLKHAAIMQTGPNTFCCESDVSRMHVTRGLLGIYKYLIFFITIIFLLFFCICLAKKAF